MELTERQEKLLRLIVEHFIDTGEPVGSKFLSSIYGSSISSATIRNEMASLSRDGYIDQPHTSAGRVPSYSGYKYYIRYLMPSASLSASEKYRILSALDTTAGDPSDILRSAAEVLAGITDCITVVSTPLSGDNKIARIEIAAVGKHTAVVILKTDSGVLKQKVIRLGEELTLETIQLFYSVAMNFFTGARPGEFTKAQIQNIVCSLGDRALGTVPLISAIAELAADSEKADMIVAGRGNVFHHRELAGDAHGILELTENKESLKNLMQTAESGISVRIGSENRYRELMSASVLTSPYVVSGRTAGSVCIIGSVGMDYPKLIPYIKFITGTVGNILTEQG